MGTISAVIWSDRYYLLFPYPLPVNQTLLFLSFLGLLGAAGRAQAQTSSNLVASADVAPSSVLKSDSIFVNPEVRPRFTGGDKAFIEYLSKNIRYPKQALDRRVSGRVLVNFILSAEGRVQDAHVISGPGNGLNDEALRLVWLMPPWEPGRSNGQPVRVACTVPIAFNSGR